MTTIAGIDPSLTSTGIAVIASDGARWSAETWARVSKGSRADDLDDRWTRLTHIAADVLDFVDGVALVVIEGPSLHSKGPGTWDRAGLWWHLVHRLRMHETPVLVVPPTTRAKFATGAGNADKFAVGRAVAKMWPAWEPSRLGVEDQHDALALASIGVVLAGLTPPFPMPAYRTEALAKVQLPEEDAA